MNPTRCSESLATVGLVLLLASARLGVGEGSVGGGGVDPNVRFRGPLAYD